MHSDEKYQMTEADDINDHLEIIRYDELVSRGEILDSPRVQALNKKIEALGNQIEHWRLKFIAENDKVNEADGIFHEVADLLNLVNWDSTSVDYGDVSYIFRRIETWQQR